MKLKVLIIEDEDHWERKIKKEIDFQMKYFPLLHFDQNEIITTDRIDEGTIKLLREDVIHLAIIDYKLNGEFDGYTAVIGLVNRKLIRRTKIIFHTAKMKDIKVALHTMRLGAFSFVIKGQEVVPINKPKNLTKELQDMADLPQLSTESENELMLGYEIRRALNEISIEEQGKIYNNKFTIKIPDILQNEDRIQKLKSGVDVKKVVLLSDLANSTNFLQWVRNEDKGAKEIGSIISEILIWQADIITKHGGYIDKFYGDEVRAYFGYELIDPENDEIEKKLCKQALDASIEIITGFSSKLSELVRNFKNAKTHKPAKWPYPRILLNYSSVHWAIYGSESYWDFTIWTKNVTLLHRIYERVRIAKPCNIVNELKFYTKKGEELKECDNNYLGEIYLTDGVKENINGSHHLCLHYKDKEYRDFENDENEISVYSLKLNETVKCKECQKNALEHTIGGIDLSALKIVDDE